MPQFVSEKAKAVRENPTDDEKIELVIGIEEGSIPRVVEWVTEHDGTIKREIPFNMILVEVPETVVSGLCDLEPVESIEFDESIEVLDKGN